MSSLFNSTPIPVGSSGWGRTVATHKVLRNTYALLSMTLLFSAAVAALGVAFKLPAPGIILTLVGYLACCFSSTRCKTAVGPFRRCLP